MIQPELADLVFRQSFRDYGYVFQLVADYGDLMVHIEWELEKPETVDPAVENLLHHQLWLRMRAVVGRMNMEQENE